MATFSITTTADQDSAIKYATDQYNASANVTVTPVQYARQRIDHLFDGLVERWKDATRTTKGQAYQNAVAAADAGNATAASDVSTMNTILQKYGA